MGLEDEEADGHGRVGLGEQRVAAGEELVEGDEIAERFAHFLTVDGDHVVVHPVAHGVMAVVGH